MKRVRCDSLTGCMKRSVALAFRSLFRFPFSICLTYNVPDRASPFRRSWIADVRVPDRRRRRLAHVCVCRSARRIVTGCVVEYAVRGECERAEDVIEVLDHEPLCLRTSSTLCRWVADYYLAGIGDAIAAAMPPGHAGRRRRSRRGALLPSPHGAGVASRLIRTPRRYGECPRRCSTRTLTPKQREALDVLAAAPAGLPLSELRDRGISADVARAAGRTGLVTLRSETRRARSVRARGDGRTCSRRRHRVLTDEQAGGVRARWRRSPTPATSAWRCCTA